MRRLLPATIALALLLPGCLTGDDATDDTPDDTTKLFRPDRTASGDYDCRGVPGTVTDASVAGDMLTYTVEYAGCRVAETWACWQGSPLETYPAILTIGVYHSDSGDCDALQSTTRSIDISLLRDHYGNDPDPYMLSVDRIYVLWQK